MDPKYQKNGLDLAILACPLCVHLRIIELKGMIEVSNSPSVGFFPTPYIQGECTKNFMSIGDHLVCQKLDQIPDVNVFNFSSLSIKNEYFMFDFFFGY